MKIKRLTEELGFQFTNKPPEEEKPIKKKRNPILDMIAPYIKPVAKEAFEAGAKKDVDFEAWWFHFQTKDNPKTDPYSEENWEIEKPKTRKAMGFLADRS